MPAPAVRFEPGVHRHLSVAPDTMPSRSPPSRPLQRAGEEVVMAGPLLETKFHVPRRGRGVVPRPRLIEGLTRRAESALTLVSAPAGFGKTTLLTEWLHGGLGGPPAGGTAPG